MKCRVLLLIFFFAINIYGQSEHPTECGTDEIHQYLLANDTGYAKGIEQQEAHIFDFIQDPKRIEGASSAIYTIPVVVHVVHLGEPVGTGTNISDAQVNQAINGLNDRFANLLGNTVNGNDMNIQFCLATVDPNNNPTNGINRVDGSSVPNYASNGIGGGSLCTGSANETTIKSLSTWPNSDYYNIWVVNDICNGQYAGYAYYPSAFNNPLDGTVMRYDYMNYSSHVLAHELGHGFFLYHTFEGGTATTCPPNTNCATQGDRCCDTPPHRVGDCGSTNPCSSSPLWINSQDNIMSYCWNFPFASNYLFTLDQRSRMQATLTQGGLRHSLALSNGCFSNTQSPNNPCDNISSINCGDTITFSSIGTGSWFNHLNNPCGNLTPGVEQIYSFAPQVTGNYNFNVTSVSNNNSVNYFWRSDSCSSTDWNCLEEVNDTGSWSVGTQWEAGVTYYILVDPEDTLSVSQTFEISCVCIDPPQPGVISGNTEICSGKSYSYSIPQTSSSLTQVWSFSGSGSISGSGNSINLIAGSSGTLSVYSKDSAQCASPLRSLAISVEETPIITGNIIGSNVYCPGQPEIYSIDSVVNAVQYRWIYNGTVEDSTTTPSFSFTPSTNGVLTVVATNGKCVSDTSQPFLISISTTPTTPSLIMGPDTSCEGAISTFYVDTVNDAVEYQWRYGGVAIDTTIDPLISFAVLQSDTLEVRAINADGCASAFSRKYVEIFDSVQATLHRSNFDSICFNQPGPSLSVSIQDSGSGRLNFYWERLNTSNGSWDTVQIGNIDHDSGTLTETSTFRVTVFDSLCNTVFVSNQIQVIVHDSLVPGVVQTLQSQQICHGEQPSTIRFSKPGGGSGHFSYQWQDSTDGNAWQDILGADSIAYTPGSLTDTSYYRLKQTDTLCSPDFQYVFTEIIKVGVYDSLVAGSPAGGIGQQICFGEVPDTVFFEAPNGGSDSIAYQWQSRTDTSSWIDIVGANALFLAPDSLFVTTYYRLKQIDLHCNPDSLYVYTDSIVISVFDELVSGALASGDGQQLCYGTQPDTLSFTSPSGGSNNFSYQWQVSTNGTSWSNIAGQTSLSFSPSNLFQTTYYRLRQTDNHCSPAQTVFTDSVVVVVYDTLVSGNISSGANQQICYGETPTPLSFTPPSGGSGNFSYQWQSSTDSINWNPAPSGLNSLTYSPGPLTDTTYFRLKQTDTACISDQEVYTNVIMVGVYNVFEPGVFSGYQDTICEGESLNLSVNNFNLTGIQGADASQYTYIWHTDTDVSGSFSDTIPTNSSLVLNTGTLTETTYYRLTVITHCGDTATYTDSLVSIYVNPLPGISEATISEQQSGQSNLCNGSLGRIFSLSDLDSNSNVGLDWSNNGQFQGFIRASDSAKILIFDEVNQNLSATFKNRQTKCERRIDWQHTILLSKQAPSRSDFVHRSDLNMLIYDDTTGDAYRWGWIPYEINNNGDLETELELIYLNVNTTLPYAMFNHGTNNHLIDTDKNIYFVEITKEGCMSRILFNDNLLNTLSNEFEDAYSSELYLYPNPSSGDVFLAGDISEINVLRLSTTLGETILIHVDKSNGRLEGIDSLASGSYVLTVQCENKTVNLRLIINK